MISNSQIGPGSLEFYLYESSKVILTISNFYYLFYIDSILYTC